MCFININLVETGMRKASQYLYDAVAAWFTVLVCWDNIYVALLNDHMTSPDTWSHESK